MQKIFVSVITEWGVQDNADEDATKFQDAFADRRRYVRKLLCWVHKSVAEDVCGGSVVVSAWQMQPRRWRSWQSSDAVAGVTGMLGEETSSKALPGESSRRVWFPCVLWQAGGESHDRERAGRALDLRGRRYELRSVHQVQRRFDRTEVEQVVEASFYCGMEKLHSETEKPISKSAEVHKREAAALLKSTKAAHPSTPLPLSLIRSVFHCLPNTYTSRPSANPEPPPPRHCPPLIDIRHLRLQLPRRSIPSRTKPHAYTVRKLSPASK
jgi:hypothetical protein